MIASFIQDNEELHRENTTVADVGAFPEDVGSSFDMIPSNEGRKIVTDFVQK